ncbi:MAG: flagellar export chaperone FliS [Spirochaetes bacterium]|nr:flagellar export chaperone FliS [Spirochaetota bacterium]
MAVPKKSAYDEYKKTQVTTANQGKLIVMLYDGAIKFITIALENMEPQKYDIANSNIIKAQDIITELLLSLNMKEGGEVSTNLFNLYIYFKKTLLDANIKKDPDILKHVLKLLKELREAWDKISASEAKSDKNDIGSKGSFSIEG